MDVSKRQGPMRLAVVTPVRDEEANLGRYFEETGRALAGSEIEIRFVLVDDGSRDRSWQIIVERAADDARVTGIRLARNFGAHAAITAGLDHAADADAVVILAADLQDPPEVVVEFVRAWRAGADVVWGARTTRGDEAWRRRASWLFLKMLRRWAMPSGSHLTTGSFLLIDRLVVEAVRSMPERNRVTFALVAWTGFEQATVEYDRRPRVAGRSGWSLGQMVKTMYDSFVGFSTLPLTVMRIVAASSAALSAVLAVYVLASALSSSNRPGWTSEMLVTSVFFSVQFAILTVVGEYLYRIFAEAVRRPQYFVSRRTGSPPDG